MSYIVGSHVEATSPVLVASAQWFIVGCWLQYWLVRKRGSAAGVPVWVERYARFLVTAIVVVTFVVVPLVYKGWLSFACTAVGLVGNRTSNKGPQTPHAIDANFIDSACDGTRVLSGNREDPTWHR